MVTHLVDKSRASWDHTRNFNSIAWKMAEKDAKHWFWSFWPHLALYCTFLAHCNENHWASHQKHGQVNRQNKTARVRIQFMNKIMYSDKHPVRLRDVTTLPELKQLQEYQLSICFDPQGKTHPELLSLVRKSHLALVSLLPTWPSSANHSALSFLIGQELTRDIQPSHSLDLLISDLSNPSR